MKDTWRSATEEALYEHAAGAVLRVLRRPDVQFVVHGACLLALITLVRPLFMASVPRQAYETPSIVQALLQQDLALVISGAQHHRPVVPRLLFLVVPTAVMLLSGRRIEWTRWESGRALRGLVMVLLGMLAWAGSTFDYNLYLGHAHALDRLLLVGLAVLSWRTPIAVPLATAWSIVMIREPSIPITLDDFDWRPVGEVLIAFSVFVWASLRPSFQTRHFLWTALGVWASYYFAAGVAKVNYGPRWSWLLEDHFSNLAVGAHVRGWLGFVPDGAFVSFAAFIRRFDIVLTSFTLITELGSVACFHIHPRVIRLWCLLTALLHLGIFALTGVCFWKWFTTNLALWFFLGRGLSRPLAEMCRQKLAILFGVAAVYFSRDRIWFYPQTRVAWYDTRFVENYKLVAVGPSGHRYIVNPNSLAPMDMHWVQGRLCYATRERSLTGIFGVTGSFATYKTLEHAKDAGTALKMLARGRSCANTSRQRVFDDFMRRFFGNMNQRGRPLAWLGWIGRPRHLWVQPRGELYDMQEPVARIELWRELVFLHGDALQRLEEKLVHQVAITPSPR